MAETTAVTDPTANAAAMGTSVRLTSNRRRPKQEMHELRAVEVNRVVRACRLQQQGDQRHGNQHRIDQRMPPRPLGQPIHRHPSRKRHRQPQ
jgi:hypothetical protein